MPNAVRDFLWGCDKVAILEGTISVVEDPLRPPEPLSRGRRKEPLCNSYKGFGLCDSLLALQVRRRGR